MKFIIKEILKCVFILLLFSVIDAQEEINSSILPPAEDEWECGLISPPLIQIDVSVWSSSSKGYLNNLTHKDFEVFEKEDFRDIEFLKFDELKNQYTIGFYQDDLQQHNVKWENIKVKIKLSKEMDFGKVSITLQKVYISKES